jgi:Spy/CpxP family protein refolding chaperone
MKKRPWLFVIAAVALAGISITALALPSSRYRPTTGGDPDSETGSGRVMGMQNMSALRDVMQLIMIGQLVNDADFRQQVDITDDQMHKISAISTADSDELKPDTDKITALGNDFSELMKADTPDVVKLDAKLDEISATQAMVNKQMLHTALDIKGVLTADQDQKIKDYIAKKQQERVKQRNSNRGQGGAWSGGGGGGRGHHGGGGGGGQMDDWPGGTPGGSDN